MAQLRFVLLPYIVVSALLTLYYARWRGGPDYSSAADVSRCVATAIALVAYLLFMWIGKKAWSGERPPVTYPSPVVERVRAALILAGTGALFCGVFALPLIAGSLTGQLLSLLVLHQAP